MAGSKPQVAAVDGWFTLDAERPALLGSRCTACGTVSFPRQQFKCPNPACPATEYAEVELSRRGRIWSYTDARYQPPPPYVAAEPYEPFALAAVELADEKLVVLGQVATGYGVEDLAIGDEVELCLETLYEDDAEAVMVWKWRPVGVAR